MVRSPFSHRRAAQPAEPTPEPASITLDAESVPAAWLRGAPVVGPSGESLGSISLLVRRSDGARLAVVRAARGSHETRRVVDLSGGHLDDQHRLHVRSGADVDILGVTRRPDAGSASPADRSGSRGGRRSR